MADWASFAALRICIDSTQNAPCLASDVLVLQISAASSQRRVEFAGSWQEKQRVADASWSSAGVIARDVSTTSDTTIFGSPRHAARPQLLAKRLLLVLAIPLHSKKILTIGFRINLDRSQFLYRGGISVSKASKKLRREAVSAQQVARDRIIHSSQSEPALLAPFAMAQEQDAAATADQGDHDDEVRRADLPKSSSPASARLCRPRRKSRKKPTRSSTRSPRPTSARSPTSPSPKRCSA